MPYRGGNFSFTINSSFKPFSLQEMMIPLAMYKEAYEKDEAAYLDLTEKADKFKYLSQTLPEGSKARAMYENYANELDAQAKDFMANGLNPGNRAALMNLKRRYSGEIGTLNRAYDQLTELQKQRNALAAAGKPMLYANEMPTIDDMLDGSNFNRYAIDSADLYARGVNLGKTISSRMYSAGDNGNVLNGYYRDWVEKNGVSQDSINAFMNSDFVKNVVDNVLVERGVDANLTGQSYDKARQSVLNGIYEGVVYQEKHNPQRDLGVPSWSEKETAARANRQLAMEESEKGLIWNGSGYDLDPTGGTALQRSLALERAKAEAKANAAGSSGKSGSSSSGSGYTTLINNGIRVSWKGNNPNELNGDADADLSVSYIKDNDDPISAPVDYDNLPQYAKNRVDAIVGEKGDYRNYIIYFKPFKKGFFNDTEAELEVVPKKLARDTVDNEDLDIYGELPTGYTGSLEYDE